MSEEYSNESMLDIYIFETTQIMQQLEQSLMECEESNEYKEDAINEIFRHMHTIKGSSAMMLFDNISSLAHCVEDLFFFLRENNPENVDCGRLSDLVFESVDFMKVEIEKIKSGDGADGESSEIMDKIRGFLEELKGQGGIDNSSCEGAQGKTQKTKYYISPSKQNDTSYSNAYRVKIFFEDGCQMENIRAYTLIHHLKDITEDFIHYPKDIVESEESTEAIRKEGFEILLRTDRPDAEISEFFAQTVFLKEMEISDISGDGEFERLAQEIENRSGNAQDSEKEQDDDENCKEVQTGAAQAKNSKAEPTGIQGQHSFISVNVSKLDMLMDLVGELVIAEAMVTQNPQVRAVQHEGFEKASRHLNKITTELQDVVMSIRMVPLSNTFFKMHRILRDMCKKLSKDAKLEVIGEDTEVDKNIIEHISDPLMHLIRNSMDHGIENAQERLDSGKPQSGTVTLEARNEGGEVIIAVRDDGKGLDKDKILQKAFEKGLIQKSEVDIDENDIYNMIFMPGFSTKENISEFSGRGVGMDVVTTNIEAVGGTIYVESEKGLGSSVIMKIPLTLAIIDGMNIRVGGSMYTVPVSVIRESFRAKDSQVIRDPEDREMIMVRNQCYPILRLHSIYDVRTDIEKIEDGILLMVEQHGKKACIFADELVGQHQVVVKGLPSYIRKNRNIRGISSCTLLGDGSISLILNVSELAV